MGDAPLVNGTLKTNGHPILIALALAVVLGWCGYCGIVGYRANAASEREAMEVAMRQIDDLKPSLLRAHAAVPPLSGLTLSPCRDAEIKGRYRDPVSTGIHGEVTLWISTVPLDVLGAWLKGTPRPGEWSEWSWMADSTLRDIMDPSGHDLPSPGQNLQLLVRSLRQRRYLGVFRSSSKALPRLTGEGVAVGSRARMIEKGKSFDPGFFHGWLIVMDMDTAVAVCQAPIDVESSETLRYWSYGLRGQRPGDVVSEDFKGRFRAASREALARISTLLKF
jgi:hypothetical protein